MILGRPATESEASPWGAILAGGQGRRMGAGKATVRVGDSPLILHVLSVVGAVLPEVAVVAKPDTALPALGSVPIWIEPDRPQHPLVGVLHALRGAAGRAVVVCAVDLPFVGEATLRTLAGGSGGGAPIRVAAAGDAIQPLLARYEPSVVPALEAALAGRLPPMRALVAGLGAERVAVDPAELFNVNTPEDLTEAARRLAQTSGRR